MSQKSCSNNIEAFLELVRAGLWTQPAQGSKYLDELSGKTEHKVQGSVGWAEVYQLAEEQSVVGLVAAGMEKQGDNLNVPLELKLQIIGEALQIEQQNREMNAFVAKLIDNMRPKGIYAILVKGQGVAQCYEHPLWRSCGDVDLLLSHDNYDKAKEFLAPLASSVETEWSYQKHLSMTIEQWVVELHGSLRTQLSSKVDRLIDQTQKAVFYGGQVRSWMNGKTQVFLPSADNDVIFIFTHFLKHFYKGGLGLRQICDWCRLLWTYRESLNHGLLESRIMKAGLMTEWKTFGAFAVEALGMSKEAMPMYSSADRWKRKAMRIQEFILMSGNMGHNREKGYGEYPYLIKKVCSMGRRISDVVNHARIFPLDSMKFLTSIMFHGIRDAVRDRSDK